MLGWWQQAVASSGRSTAPLVRSCSITTDRILSAALAEGHLSVEPNAAGVGFALYCQKRAERQ